ncbi:MAG: LLM class flavin-dependent oxidoreductase, partial [Acidimicrobiia bacterium]|nr:LLM class flavin-dependent oxidoreductase [Acidimicrobiia bacterium]
HGIGLLSIGATMQIGADVLALHYDVWDEMAKANGHNADREKWRLVGLMHIAETKEQAMRDVEYGIEHWFDYLQQTAAAPQFCPEGDTLQERINWVNESGVGAIGTAEDCIRQIEALWKQSGGFGGYLCMDHDFANPAAKARSYELLAQRVMPHFQNNTHARLADAVSRAQQVREKLNAEQAEAIEKFTAAHASQASGS